MLHDVELGEGLLEDFEVVEILVVEFGLPVDLGEGYFAGVDDIEELAVGGTGPQLLNFRVVNSQQCVQPVQQLPPGQLDRVVRVARYLIDHSCIEFYF